MTNRKGTGDSIKTAVESVFADFECDIADVTPVFKPAEPDAHLGVRVETADGRLFSGTAISHIDYRDYSLYAGAPPMYTRKWVVTFAELPDE